MDFMGFYYPLETQNITILYGCPGTAADPGNNGNGTSVGTSAQFTCRIKGVSETYSYYQSGGTGPNGCHASVVVPIIASVESQIDRNLSLSEAVRNGFKVNYKQNEESTFCDECVASLGRCGSDLSKGYATTCVCRDGSYGNTSCDLKDYSKSSQGPKRSDSKILISMIIILSFLVFVLASFLLRLCLRKLSSRMATAATDSDDHDFTAESLQYNLARLQDATNNFSNDNILGEGGFGCVYKGTLSNGELIAVKRLSARSSQGIQEFKTEVLLVAKLQHRNLVRLLGFCYTRHEKILVYEYVANKSLDNFLFDNENRRLLRWQVRYNVIIGIARGLLYLHHDSRLRIIHRDLKASNVLLDDEMNPKISDFGTSRIFGVDHTQSTYTNRVVGTYGYMAPEYALQGQFSIKSDVYSFGVLILEIISGGRNNNFNQHSDVEDLLSFGWKQWEAGTPLECVDPIIRDSCSDINEVMRCLHIGLLCVQVSAGDRPTMANVVLTLDDLSASLPIPKQPDFFARCRPSQSVADNGTSLSANDVSVTELEPR